MNTYTNTLVEARELRAGAWTTRPGKEYPEQVVRVTLSTISPITGRMAKARFYFDDFHRTKNYDEHYLDSLVANL